MDDERISEAAKYQSTSGAVMVSMQRDQDKAREGKLVPLK